MAQVPATLTAPRDVVVLVVEDESRLRELLQRAISGWGFVVATACNAAEALAKNQAEPADIAIIDLNLPGIGGIELLGFLREQSPAIEAIVLTGYATVEAAKRAVHLRVVEFLIKPCHLGDLERALDRAIRRLSPWYAVVTEPPFQDAERMTLEALEKRHIEAVLKQNNGNRTATAAALGISRRALYDKLMNYEREWIDEMKHERPRLDSNSDG